MPDQYARPTPKKRGRGASRTCEQCGATFETYPYLLRRFCSRSCRSLWLNANVPRRLRSAPRVTIPCAACGKPLSILVSRKARNPRCSIECANVIRSAIASLGETRICVICAAPFYFSASRKREGQPGRACSLKCRGAWQKRQPRNSTSRDSAAYREWRAAVYRRDNYTCQRCGERSTRKNRLHAHHIKYWADSPELRFEVSNGLLLCGSCHAREHFDVSALNGRSRA